MNPKTIRTTGWVLSGLLAALLILGSARGKLTDWEGKAQMFEHLGYSTELMAKIGIVEGCLAVLFLIPRASFLGALLLTAYMGGATATHVRVGDPFISPIIVGIFVWIGYGLRHPEVLRVALGVDSGGGKADE